MTDSALMLFLHALSLVESGGNAAAVGRRGERGAFQMMPAVVAECGGYGERQAAAKLRLLARELEHAGVDPQPFNLALAWNAGLGAVLRARALTVSYQHAGRVCALFEQLSRQPQPRPAGPASPDHQPPGSWAGRGGKQGHNPPNPGAAAPVTMWAGNARP